VSADIYEIGSGYWSWEVTEYEIAWRGLAANQRHQTEKRNQTNATERAVRHVLPFVSKGMNKRRSEDFQRREITSSGFQIFAAGALGWHDDWKAAIFFLWPEEWGDRIDE